MRRSVIMLCLLIGLAGCERPSPSAEIVAIDAPVIMTSPPPDSNPVPLTATPPLANTAVPTATPTATPFYTGQTSPACGQQLPLLPENKTAVTTSLAPSAAAVAQLRAIVPVEAWPAVQQMLDSPDSVGLVLYQAGNEANGVYLNAERAMPLASVSKLIHLVAYSERVASGELNPEELVPVETLDAYYLPNFDLGAHERALAELEESGRLVGVPPAVRLDDVVWMMVRHSSNAATDYLHNRLGQGAIEETAVWLNLAEQTAPCPFIGQFLAMGNHTRQGISDQTAVEQYQQNPALYGEEVMLLADAYINDPAFRAAEQAWRWRDRGPTGQTQRLFSHALNTHATPLAYANLMNRLAQNGLSSGESSFVARRQLEWPMRFATNQERFTNLGYKNGSLPGILTTVYYAYRPGETAPLIIALFFQDLPGQTYRQWRFSLPHDEFARWALAEPAALPALRAVLGDDRSGAQ